MHVVKEEFNQRIEEINSYFTFLDRIINRNVRFIDENRQEYSLTTSTHTIAKASSIILLYNLIESIITKCLMTIHEFIRNDSLLFNEMTPQLKKMVLLYYNHVYSKGNNASEAIDSIMTGVELILNNQCFNIPYLEMIKHYSLYSGNLDSREVRLVLSKYGIQFEERYPALKCIKEYRNKLAHGESSFEECGRELTYQQLDHYRLQTFEFIEKMIEEIENYLNNKKYRDV